MTKDDFMKIRIKLDDEYKFRLAYMAECNNMTPGEVIEWLIDTFVPEGLTFEDQEKPDITIDKIKQLISQLKTNKKDNAYVDFLNWQISIIKERQIEYLKKKKEKAIKQAKIKAEFKEKMSKEYNELIKGSNSEEVMANAISAQVKIIQDKHKKDILTQ